MMKEEKYLMWEPKATEYTNLLSKRDGRDYQKILSEDDDRHSHADHITTKGLTGAVGSRVISAGVRGASALIAADVETFLPRDARLLRNDGNYHVGEIR